MAAAEAAKGAAAAQAAAAAARGEAVSVDAQQRYLDGVASHALTAAGKVEVRLAQEGVDLDLVALGGPAGAPCEQPSVVRQDARYLYVAGNRAGAPHAAWIRAAGAVDRGSVVLKIRKNSWKLGAAVALPAAHAGISALVGGCCCGCCCCGCCCCAD